MTLSSKLQRTVINGAKNPGLERDIDWSNSAVSRSLGTIAKVSNQKFMRSYAKKITKDNTLGLHQITQSLILEKGKTYNTLPAWLKRDSVTSSTGQGLIYVSSTPKAMGPPVSSTVRT